MRGGCSAAQVLSLAGGDNASPETRELALKLLCGEKLSEEEAYRLGKRVFDLGEPSTVLRCSSLVLGWRCHGDGYRKCSHTWVTQDECRPICERMRSEALLKTLLKT